MDIHSFKVLQGKNNNHPAIHGGNISQLAGEIRLIDFLVQNEKRQSGWIIQIRLKINSKVEPSFSVL